MNRHKKFKNQVEIVYPNTNIFSKCWCWGILFLFLGENFVILTNILLNV